MLRPLFVAVIKKRLVLLLVLSVEKIVPRLRASQSDQARPEQLQFCSGGGLLLLSPAKRALSASRRRAHVPRQNISLFSLVVEQQAEEVKQKKERTRD